MSVVQLRPRTPPSRRQIAAFRAGLAGIGAIPREIRLQFSWLKGDALRDTLQRQPLIEWQPVTRRRRRPF